MVKRIFLKKIIALLFFMPGIYAHAMTFDAEPVDDAIPSVIADDYRLPTSLLDTIPETPVYVADLSYTEQLVSLSDPTNRDTDDWDRNMSKASESKGGFFQGWQFGVGLPLVLPMTGYNAWVGYMNKKSSWWLGRRIGARVDFLIRTTLSLTGSLRDNGNGYDVDATARFMGFKMRRNSVFDMDKISFDNMGTEQYLNLNGANAVISLGNQFFGGLIDFYPFGDTWFLGGWRISGGYYHGNMKLGLSANVPDDVLGNGYLYEIANSGHFINANIPSGKGRVAANFNWRYSGPYAGLGFDLGVFRGVKFFMDAGVVFARPPRIRQSDIALPELAACYTVGTGTCGNDGWVRLSLNGQNPPSADSIMTNVLAQLIQQNVEHNASVPPEVLQAILASNGGRYDMGNGNVNFNLVAGDVFRFLNQVMSEPDWMTDTGLNNTPIEEALQNIQTNWNGSNLVNDLQVEIDNMWADYQQSIYDINNNLKDMRFMPVVKLGIMYRF